MRLSVALNYGVGVCIARMCLTVYVEHAVVGTPCQTESPPEQVFPYASSMRLSVRKARGCAGRPPNYLHLSFAA